MTFSYAMQYGPDDISGKFGVPIPSATVNIYLTGTNTPATLYTSTAKVATAPNPTFTDTLGNLTFFADPGTYDVAIDESRFTVVLPLNPSEPESGGGGGSGVPIGDQSKVATSISYTDPVSHDAIDVLTFSADTSAIALALTGDSYPQVVIRPDTDSGNPVFAFSDGTFDPLVGPNGNQNGVVWTSDPTYGMRAFINSGKIAASGPATDTQLELPTTIGNVLNVIGLAGNAWAQETYGSTSFATFLASHGNPNSQNVPGNLRDFCINTLATGSSDWLWQCTTAGTGGSAVWTAFTGGAAGALLAANNLSDVANAGTSRTNLGLGTAATQNSSAFLQPANNLSDVSSAATSLTNLSGANRFIPTAVVTTTTVTIAANRFVPFDTTSNAITATLPTAPADGSVVGLKLITIGGANTVTYNCGGSDHFNKTTGPTTGTLSLLNQAAFYQYNAALAVWYNIGDDIPLSQLDSRYLGIAATAGGDLSGNYPNPTVAKINGSPLGTTTGATVGELLEWNGSAWAPATPPTSVPPISAMDAWGHSYLSGGTAIPTAQQIGLMSRLLGDFHVAETNFLPMVSGGATVLVPSGQSQGSWDAVFQKRMPPLTTGYIAENNGLTLQPVVQWPLTNGPLFVGVNGFNDFAFNFQPYGVFNSFNFGVTLAIPGGTQGYSNGFAFTAGTNATTGGTYLPNRVGGAGVQVGDFLSASGIRGFAKVSAVNFNSLTTTTITAATNSSTTVTCTAAGTYTIGEIVYISGAAGGTFSNINGAWTVTTGGTGSFQIVVNVAPTGSYTGSSGSVQGGTFISIPSAQVTGSPTVFFTVPSRSTSGQAVTGLQNAFQGVIERAISGAVTLSTDTGGTDTKFAYGGSTNAWAAVSNANANTFVGFVGGTGSSQMITYANNDTFTYTIDPKFPGGVVAIVLTGPVTSDLDNSGASVAWSGTASSATGSTTIAGQGWGGQPVPVVKRFVLTGADAGKTIIGTFNNGTPCTYTLSSTLNSTTTVTGTFAPNITPGMGVSGTDIPANTYVVSVNATQTSLTLSQAATGSTTTNLTYTSTVCQVDHASYEATYMSPVLLANQPVVGPGGIYTPTCAAVLDKAITQAIATFTGTSPQTVCGVTNNYNTIGKADVVTYFSKRSFWLGTTLASASGLTVTYDTSSKNDTGITLIGQRTVSQGDQVAPFVGQYVSIPNAVDGDVNEVCLITAVASTSNATITGGTPAAGTYPAWNVTLARGLRSFANSSVYVTGNTNFCAAATGSTTAPTQGVYDVSWTQPIDYVHPGIGGSGLWASVFEQAYQTFANQTPDWVGTANQSWAFGRTRSVPVPLNNGWWSNDGTFGAGTSNAIGSTVFCQRFVTPVPIIVDKIGVDVTTAGATTLMSAGMFISAQGGSMPSTTVLFDYGLNNVSMSALGFLFCTGWQLVPPGEYWVAVAFGNNGAARCESMTAVNDDFPQWRNVQPTAGNHHLGWQGTPSTSSGSVTNLAPSSGWSESTSFIPWIVVHAYQHTYLVGS